MRFLTPIVLYELKQICSLLFIHYVTRDDRVDTDITRNNDSVPRIRNSVKDHESFLEVRKVMDNKSLPCI